MSDGDGEKKKNSLQGEDSSRARGNVPVFFILTPQAICAKCSKTLDNKTCRLCPECYEASLSLENLGVGEQKRKAAAEVNPRPPRPRLGRGTSATAWLMFLSLSLRAWGQ